MEQETARPRDRDTGLAWPSSIWRIVREPDFAISRSRSPQRVQRPKQLSFSQPDSVSLVLLKSGPTLCMSFALEKESRGAEESKSDFAPKKNKASSFFLSART